MEHSRLFHDYLFIIIGIAFLIIALRAIASSKAMRTAGIVLGVLNVLVAVMDILHTPGH